MPFVSDLLTATPATVDGNPTPNRTWQWLRGSTPISGANSNIYTVQEADIGETISVRQTETNFMGTTSAISLVTSLVFTPLSLFDSGEQGVWYEPSQTTAFKSTTDLTPCEYGGTDGCGFLLDKSQGAGYSGGSFTGLGAEELADPSFDSGATEYTAGANWSFAGGNATASGVNTAWASGPNILAPERRLTQSGVLTIGKTYLLEIVLTGSAPRTGTTTIGLINGTGFSDPSDFIDLIDAAPGDSYPKTNQVVVVAETQDFVLSYSSADQKSVTVGEISVKELPGNHATQTNAPARPILARVPEGGRRNIVAPTSQTIEDWSIVVGRLIVADGQAAGVSGSNTLAKLTINNGNITSCRTQSDNISISASTNYTASAYVRAGDAGYVFFYLKQDSTHYVGALFDTSDGSTIDSGVAGGTVVSASSDNLGGGLYRIKLTFTLNQTANVTFDIGVTSSASASLGEFGYSSVSNVGTFEYAGDAQIEEASSATAYQRVVSEYDITEAGVDSLEYLSFETDDFMLPPSGISSGWIAGHAISAQKGSGSNNAAIIAQWGTANSIDHEPFSSVLYSGFGYSTRGQFGAFTGADTSIVEYEVSSSGLIARINGTQSGSTHTGGSVAWRPQPFIGRDINGTFFYNGDWFGSIVLDRNLTTQEASDTRTYLANRSGVTLA